MEGNLTVLTEHERHSFVSFVLEKSLSVLGFVLASVKELSKFLMKIQLMRK